MESTACNLQQENDMICDNLDLNLVVGCWVAITQCDKILIQLLICAILALNLVSDRGMDANACALKVFGPDKRAKEFQAHASMFSI